MKLTYRGISFNTQIAGAPSQETEETGTFLGNSYKIKQAATPHRHASSELTYRGVRYSR